MHIEAKCEGTYPMHLPYSRQYPRSIAEYPSVPEPLKAISLDARALVTSPPGCIAAGPKPCHDVFTLIQVPRYLAPVFD